MSTRTSARMPQMRGMHGGGAGFKPVNTKKTVARLIKYITKNKLILVLVAVLVLVASGAGVAGTYMLSPVINTIGQALKGEIADPMVQIVKYLLILGVIYICGAGAQYAYQRVMVSLTHNTLNSIRRDLFDHLQDLPISFFDKHTHGEIMSRFTNDTDTLREAMSQGLTQIMSSLVSVVGTFIMMTILSPQLMILILIMLAIMLFATKTVGSRSAKYFRLQQKNVGSVNGYIEEMIEGQRVVKAFCREDKVIDEFREINGELKRASVNAHTFASIIMPIMGNLSYMNYALTAALGAWLILKKASTGMIGMSIGQLASFLQYTRQFSMPIANVSQQINNILAALAGAERIFEVIDTPIEVDDGYVTLVNAKINPDGSIEETTERTGVWAWRHPHQAAGSVTYTLLKGDVRFHNVSFSYDNVKPVLKNINIEGAAGHKYAFVGSTGAGKTTITNLINRFYDVQEGKITYDGINIKKIKKADLRRSLGMVLQDTHLFTGTVEDNIRYGRLDATFEEIVEAAKLANAHSFIERLPQGYKTMLSGDGGNLSQGQRQLISIARAAVADPPVLILDEATSSIDTRTEHLVEQGMDKLMEGRTVFVIAHRLSTVRNSNQIIVLENGEIIEQGDHNELLAQKGRYYALYTGQFELS